MKKRFNSLICILTAVLLSSCVPGSNAGRNSLSKSEKMNVLVLQKKKIIKKKEDGHGVRPKGVPSFIVKWVVDIVVDNTVGKLTDASAAKSSVSKITNIKLGDNTQYLLVYRTFENKSDSKTKYKPNALTSINKLIKEKIGTLKNPNDFQFDQNISKSAYLSFAALLKFEKKGNSSNIRLVSYHYPVLKAAAYPNIIGPLSLGFAKKYDDKSQALVLTLTPPKGGKPPVNMVFKLDWQPGSNKRVDIEAGSKESRPVSGDHAFVPWSGGNLKVSADILETAEITSLLKKAEEKSNDWLVDAIE